MLGKRAPVGPFQAAGTAVQSLWQEPAFLQKCGAG